MRLSDEGLEIRGWQFCCIIGLVGVMVIAVTITALTQKSIELEKAKVVEAERTKRGHWLWGSKSDDVIEGKKITEEHKTSRGHWLWGTNNDDTQKAPK